MSNTLSIKNYRCFGHKPQVIQLGKGFTAFVGPNNSGKSAVLKLLYELRNLWTYLSSPQNLTILVGSSGIEIGLCGVKDSAEIINHFNNAPIELSFHVEGVEYIFDFTLRVVRENSSQVSVSAIGDTKVDGVLTNFRRVISEKNDAISLGIEQQTSTGSLKSSVSVNDISNFFKKIKNSIYVPAFRNIINAGQNTTHYDLLTGTAFVEQWSKWKVGNTKFEKDQIANITNDIRDLFGFQSLEINASDDKTTLMLIIDGKNYSLDEVGAGLSQFILTYASVAVRQPDYVLIDEPELNLHPTLQLKYLSSLAAYAKEGVLFSTHSLGLARSAENVYSLFQEQNEAIVQPFSQTKDYSTLLGEMSFSAYSEIGVDSILFVEGVTDVKCVQELLRKYEKDTKVLIMSLGGEDMINGKHEQELSEITTRVDVKKVFAWFDSEKSSETDTLQKNRQDFLDVCRRLGITAKESDKRATENYFTQKALDQAFGPGKYTELGDFGARGGSSSWSKSQNWKIAREIDKSDIDRTDLGQFIKNIK